MPRTPAINPMTRKVTAQLNMMRPLSLVLSTGACHGDVRRFGAYRDCFSVQPACSHTQWPVGTLAFRQASEQNSLPGSARQAQLGCAQDFDTAVSRGITFLLSVRTTDECPFRSIRPAECTAVR